MSGAVQPEPDVQTRERATTLLRTFAGGDAHAADELTPMLYDQLRALAGSVMAQERASHTLQPTALVHEAYVRLIDQRTDKVRQCPAALRDQIGVSVEKIEVLALFGHQAAEHDSSVK